MKLFRKIGHLVATPVTAPVTLARNTVRVIAARNAAVALIDVLDAAADNPTLYRVPSWWTRLFAAGGRLVAVIPIAPEVRTAMKNSSLKLAAVGGLVVTLVSQLDPSVLQGILHMIPEGYRPIAMALVAAVTAGAAYAHPAPGQK